MALTITLRDMQVKAEPQESFVKSTFLTSAKVAADPDGLRWFGRLVQRINDIVKIVFVTAPLALVNAASHFGNLGTLVECVEPLKRGRQLLGEINREIPNWASIGALVFTLAQRILTLVNYLHKIGVPYLNEFARTVGSMTVVSGVSFVANVFDLTQNAMAIEGNTLEKATALAALRVVEIKREQIRATFDQDNKLTAGNSLNDLDHAINTLNDRRNELAAKVGKRDQRIVNIGKLIGAPTTLKTAAVFHNAILDAHRICSAQQQQQVKLMGYGNVDISEDEKQATRAYIVSKMKTDVTLWTKEVNNTDINWNKALLAAISAISKLAIIILSTIGNWTAIPALAFSSPLCVGVAFAVAAIALTKLVYGKIYDEKAMATNAYAIDASLATEVNRHQSTLLLAV